MPRRLWTRVFLVYLFIPLALLVCGGDFGWRQAWLYSLLIFNAGIGGRIWAGQWHPGLLAERQSTENFKNAKAWNKVLAPLMAMSSGFPMVIVAGPKSGIRHAQENTLVIWSSDNGPMYPMHPHGGYSLLPGEKGETLGGGIRVPAIVSWPGMIEAFQEPDGIVDVTDWFTTVANIAGVKDKIPNDRVTDGVDQSSLLLEKKSRRDWNFHYNHPGLEVVRKDQIKFRLHAEVKHHNLYNIYYDPAERFPIMVEIALWAGSPMQKIIQDHNKMIEKFPHQQAMTGHLADFDYPFDPDPTK